MMGAATEKACLPRFSFVLGIERENADRGGNWVKLYTKLAIERIAPLDRLTKTWQNTVPADMHCGCWPSGHPEPRQTKGHRTAYAKPSLGNQKRVGKTCARIAQRFTRNASNK